MKKTQHNQSERGAVSLFIVIFSALLVTIVTVSFVQLMLRTQQEASTVDLSQSAYDSALAGVEDAKRAIIAAEQSNSANNALDSNQCDSVAVALGQNNSSGETLVRQDTATDGDTKLDQAYTCVKVNRATDDVRDDNLTQGESQLIPLRGAKPFTKVKISWGLPKSDDGTSKSPTLRVTDGSDLPRDTEWGINTPALFRTQLIQHGSSFSLSDFDSDTSGAASSNNQTHFLYPTDGVDTKPVRSGNDSSPTPIDCTSSPDAVYSCEATLDVPDPENGSAGDRVAYLRLDALYNAASYRIELIGANGKPVQFVDVQAQVDSTGRAGDVFRRVEALVNLKITKFPYPTAAIDLEENLCKTFRVTNKTSEYNAGACKPYEPAN